LFKASLKKEDVKEKDPKGHTQNPNAFDKGTKT